MSDCRTCAHNSYLGVKGIEDWVSCGHPVTLDKTPRWEKGDPAMVDYRTGDAHVSQLHNIRDCPTWAPDEQEGHASVPASAEGGSHSPVLASKGA